jgi:Domain of unknown function (DUF4328)
VSASDRLDVAAAERRSKVAIGFLFAGIAADVLNIAVTVTEVVTLERYLDGRVGAAEANRALERSGAVAIVTLVVLVGTVISWLMWQHRSQANVRAAGVPRLEFTPGWAVGWWFVPIANLWKPFQAMNELHRASRGDPDWRLARTWPVLGWWWAGYLAFSFLDGIAGALFTEETASLQPLLTGDRVSIAGDVLSIVVAFLAIRIVRAVVDRQRRLPEMVAVAPPPPPRPDLGALPPGGLPGTP